jgi:hypothetical protein
VPPHHNSLTRDPSQPPLVTRALAALAAWVCHQIPARPATPVATGSRLNQTEEFVAISVQPVVMAGGSGTRLWPLSRSQFPKQFLTLSNERSLLQQAVQRRKLLAGDDVELAATSIVGNDAHRFLIRILETGAS